ncbi:MAG: galactokinase [Acidobacteriota bacterium]
MHSPHDFDQLRRTFLGLFGEGPQEARLFSAPGRIEIGGNHTDHNHGRVLAAAVDLDSTALARSTESGRIRVHSAGYPGVFEVDLNGDWTAARADEKESPTALIRGVASGLAGHGVPINGLDAAVDSRIGEGSGLSSSAAFEVLLATALNDLCGAGRVDQRQIAGLCQRAERNYFGKPTGLMDQTVSARGGTLFIDFRDAENPLIEPIIFDWEAAGLQIVVVNTGSSHADLTAEYAAITSEMQSVAFALGGSVLRDISRDDFLAQMGALHGRVSDRALLRALHFFDEDDRVVRQVAALRSGEVGEFLKLVGDSGRSSWMFCQNCYRLPGQQGIPIGLAASGAILEGSGAWRVHGGGFAGTILAFVPKDRLTRYLETMDALFGQEACEVVTIRKAGAGRLKTKD